MDLTKRHHHKYAYQLESPPETQHIFAIKPHQRKKANAAQGCLLLAIWILRRDAAAYLIYYFTHPR